MYKLPKSKYLANGDYATFIKRLRESHNGWSGSLLTTTITKAQQEYTDSTD